MVARDWCILEKFRLTILSPKMDLWRRVNPLDLARALLTDTTLQGMHAALHRAVNLQFR